MAFGIGVANYAKRTGLSLDKAVVSICIQATTSIIKRSPVDTGRFRGNWFTSIDSFSNETSETRTENEALAEGIKDAQNASGHIFTLSNNLDYAMTLEYGLFPWANSEKVVNHFSTQAPSGFLRLTKLELENKLRKM